MTKPESVSIRKLLDAAIVRCISNGTWQSVERKYQASNGFESVSAWTCPATEASFPFPSPLPSTLRLGCLGTSSGGPPNWGYQGNYQHAPPTGLWPEIETRLGEAISIQRVYYNSSAAVMNAVLQGTSTCGCPETLTLTGPWDA